MQFSRSILALSAFLSAVMASPVVDARTIAIDAKTYKVGAATEPAKVALNATIVDLTASGKRGTGNIYLCNDAYWQGYCVLFVGIGNAGCQNLGDNTNNQLSSVGPDPGISCNLYDDPNCSGSYLYGVISPGYDNLGPGFNNELSSIQCWTY